MIDKRHEAIRLADEFETGNQYIANIRTEAAAELRRLHAVNAELLEALKIADELAKALEEMKEQIEQAGQTHCLGSCYEAANRLLKTWWKTSGAAIAKAEGK